ncbi:MAG: hypothetical protein JNM11_00365 [Chitinimonas sp.]|nr:hypothetical protein [Chitinimonas sp.]
MAKPLASNTRWSEDKQWMLYEVVYAGETIQASMTRSAVKMEIPESIYYPDWEKSALIFSKSKLVFAEIAIWLRQEDLAIEITSHLLASFRKRQQS